MFKKVVTRFILLVLIISGMAGCRRQEEPDGFKGQDIEAVHDTFLLFNEEGTNPDLQKTGSLYIKKKDRKATLISMDVLESGFQYDNSNENVLFVDQKYALYLYQQEGPPVKIAEQVNDFKSSYLDQGKIFYRDISNDLYVYWDEQTEKISEASFQYDLLDDQIYYLERDNLHIFNLKTKEKLLLADGVDSFKLLNKKGDIVYINNEGEIFYLNVKEKEDIRLDTGYVSPFNLIIEGNILYYLQLSNEAPSSLKKK